MNSVSNANPKFWNIGGRIALVLLAHIFAGASLAVAVSDINSDALPDASNSSSYLIVIESNSRRFAQREQMVLSEQQHNRQHGLTTIHRFAIRNTSDLVNIVVRGKSTGNHMLSSVKEEDEGGEGTSTLFGKSEYPCGI